MEFRPIFFVAMLVTASLSFTALPARATAPSTQDCLTASETANQLASQHRLRAERKQLLICAAPSCPGEIRQECSLRFEEVDRVMPSIVFEAKDAAGNDLSAVTVAVDGELLAYRLEGVPLGVDPGEHQFVFQAAGYPAIQKQLVILQSQKDRRETIVFAQLGAGAAAQGLTPATASVQGVPDVRARAPGKPEESGKSRAPAYVIGGIGAVGIVVGVVTRAVAFGKKSTIEGHCDANRVCDPTGMDAVSSARTLQTVSTIALIAGSAALGIGIYLGVSGDRRSETPNTAFYPAVTPNGAAIALLQRF